MKKLRYSYSPGQYEVTLMERVCSGCNHPTEKHARLKKSASVHNDGKCKIPGCQCEYIQAFYYPVAYGQTLVEALGNMVLLHKELLGINF